MGRNKKENGQEAQNTQGAQNEQGQKNASQLVGNGNFLQKLGDALTIDTDSYMMEINNVMYARKEYKPLNPIQSRESITITNKSMIESIEKINCALNGRKMLTYVICRELYKISKQEETLKNLGYKNVADFAKSFFDLETSTANHYAKIGELFITDDYTVIHPLPQLKIGHLIELSALASKDGIERVAELYLNNTLIDGMSTKKIRAILKELDKPAIEDKQESEESPKSEESASQLASEQSPASEESHQEQESTSQLASEEHQEEVTDSQKVTTCVNDILSLVAKIRNNFEAISSILNDGQVNEEIKKLENSFDNINDLAIDIQQLV